MSQEDVLMTGDQLVELAEYVFGPEFVNPLAREIAARQDRPVTRNDARRVSEMTDGRRRITPSVAAALLGIVQDRLEPHREIAELADRLMLTLADYPRKNP